MVEHTPGPWFCQPTNVEGPDYGIAIVAGNLGGLVGAALPWPTEIDSGDMSRVEANALVMAAAPDLLAAIEPILPIGDPAYPNNKVIPLYLKMLVAADDEAKPRGIMDCVDNDGHPYQSAYMAGLIMHAWMLSAPYDHAAALSAFRGAQS